MQACLTSLHLKRLRQDDANNYAEESVEPAASDSTDEDGSSSSAREENVPALAQPVAESLLCHVGLEEGTDGKRSCNREASAFCFWTLDSG
jgi:hypothetical protein